MILDKIDSKLLHELQKNAHLTSQQLGDRLNLSPSQAGRRRQRLEAGGLITGYAAQLDPITLGLNVQAFIQVHMASHEPKKMADFKRTVDSLPSITNVWILTGDADYLLQVFCENLAALNQLIQDVLLPQPSVARVQSQIVMNQPKANSPLPT